MQKTGFQLQNDDEIVTSEQEESDPVDDENYEDKDNNNNGSSRNSIKCLCVFCVCSVTDNNQIAVLINYCFSKESETL
ncbi:hypothetical protein TNCV_2444671 [Trichonephila clavipes]|nr:hypothetical protein TNCV_2444671 [Trichonephila clavipes]